MKANIALESPDTTDACMLIKSSNRISRLMIHKRAYKVTFRPQPVFRLE